MQLHRILASALFAVVLCPALQAQTTLYVDPDPLFGSDLHPGTQSQPLRTITKALSLVGSGSGTILLEDGVYAAASTESFPLTVPSGVGAIQIRGLNPGGATVSYPFSVSPPGTGAFELLRGDVVFDGFVIDTGNHGIKYVSGSGGTNLLVNDMRIDSGFDAIVLRGQSTTVGVVDSHLTAVSYCLRADSTVSANYQISLVSSRLDEALQGVTLNATATGVVHSLAVSGTVFDRIGNGILADGPGRSSASVVSSTFYSCGLLAFPSAVGGGIVDNGSRNAFSVYNCIFDSNLSQRDFPAFNPLNDSLQNCIVQQASLIGVGGSFAGTPLFVDAAGGDFHVLAASPAIDAGSSAVSGLDMDGHLVGADCASGAPDIGADEYVQDFLYLSARLVQGTTVEARVHGLPGDTFAVLYVAPFDTNGDGQPGPLPALCSPAVSPSPSLLGTGTVGANGLGTLTFTVPSGGLAGGKVWMGSTFLTPTLLRIGKNTLEEVIL